MTSLFDNPLPEKTPNKKVSPADQKRHAELSTEIRRHNELYYNGAAPEISDYDYDALKRELETLENTHPELRSADSPTNQVGAPVSEIDGKKITHRERMLSLHNSYNAEDLKKFCDRVGLRLKDNGFEVGGFMTELKIDGLAVTVIYEHGKLALGATRGDGRVGEDITENIKQVAGVPLQLTPTKNLPTLPARLEVRGEVYLPRENFLRLRDEQEMSGERIFANPRNAAAGTLKVKNSAVIRERGLAAFFYASPDAFAMNANSQNEILARLKELGLPTNPQIKLCETYTEIIARRDELDSLRHNLPYDTDGMVVKVNSVAAQSELGNDSKAPVWAVAYKFMPEQAETTLSAIRIQVGKFGTLTPVADLEPVLLSGSTIASATLHNLDYISEKDLRVGDCVVIEKAGEIIPQVVKCLPEKRRGDETVFAMPTTCPSCGADVIKDAEKIAYYCPNSACPAQARARLLHFTSRAGMNLLGFGEAVIDALLAKNLVADVADLFYLTPAQLADALDTGEIIGEKNAAKIIAALPKVAANLSAPFASSDDLLAILTDAKIATAKTRKGLAQNYFASPEKLLAASTAELAALDLGLYEQSVKNLSEAIDDAKKRTLADLLSALSISHIGGGYGRVLAEKFLTMEKLMTASAAEISAIETGETFSYRAATNKSSDVKRTLGDVAAQSLVDFFADEHNRKIIERLLAVGVNMTQPQKIISTDSAVTGKTFVLTGTLPNLGRAEAKKIIEDAGGKVSGAVSRSTNYVVAGAEAGSKLNKAQEYGVAIIDEAELLRLCGK